MPTPHVGGDPGFIAWTNDVDTQLRAVTYPDTVLSDVDKTGATNVATSLQTFLTSLAGKTGFIPDGIYTSNSALTLPYNASLILSSNAIIRAGAAIAGPLLTVGDTTNKWRNQTLEGGTFDCNDLAQTGIKLPFFLNSRVRDLTVIDSTDHSIILGDASIAPDACNELIMRDVKVDRANAGTPPAGKYGIWNLSVSNDNTFDNCIVVGADTSFRNDGGGNRFINCHGWGWTGFLPDVVFDDNGYNNDYVACNADTPSQYGFRMRGYVWRIIGGQVLVGSLGADNVVVGVYSDNGFPTASITGTSFVGGSSSFRLAADINISPNTFFTAIGCTQEHVVTARISDAEHLRAIQSASYVQPNKPSSGPRIYGGTGSPDTFISAPAGSVYHRGDTPTTANQRIYVNTDGATAWTGIL